jgi:hypothetical protein
MMIFVAGPDHQDEEREEEKRDYEDEIDDMLTEVTTTGEDE